MNRDIYKKVRQHEITKAPTDSGSSNIKINLGDVATNIVKDQEEEYKNIINLQDIKYLGKGYNCCNPDCKKTICFFKTIIVTKQLIFF